jgi:hypothetical protein
VASPGVDAPIGFKVEYQEGFGAGYNEPPRGQEHQEFSFSIQREKKIKSSRKYSTPVVTVQI